MHGLGPSDFPTLTGGSPPPNAAAALVTAVIGKPPPESEIRQFISTLDRYLGTIEPGRAADCAEYLLATLGTKPAALLEELMQTKTRTYHSAYSDRLRAEGREEGAVREARSALIELFESTQTGITPEQRRRIEACGSLQELKAWRAKFLTTMSAANFFDE